VIAATRVFQLDSQSPLGSDGEPLPGREITEEHERAWAVFALTRLRPEQVVRGVLQSTTLATMDHESHIVIKLIQATSQQEFVRRYGDAGEAELEEHGGTIPQRLLLMNGELVRDRTKDDNIFLAVNRIANYAGSDEQALETAWLATLTRRPTIEELAHFTGRLQELNRKSRIDAMEDLFWDLLNSTEFSWNH
jgi:hypothetical protein